MKFIKKKTQLLLLLLLPMVTVLGQGFSDHNKKTIVEILAKEKGGFTYSLDGTSGKLSWTEKFKTRPYILSGDRVASVASPNDSSLLTSIDASAITLSGSFKNINESYKDFLSNLNQPTLEFSVTYSLNAVQWINWNKLRLFRHNFFKQWDFYIKGFANNTFSQYFDTVSRQLSTSRWKLFNAGLQADFIGYNKRYWIVVTGSLIRGMAVDNLKSFQDKSPTSVNASPPVFSMEDATGKYGPELVGNQWNFRTSLSVPIFLGDAANANKRDKFLSNFCLIPYYAPYGTYQQKFYQLAGASLGVLKEKYSTDKGHGILIKPVLQIGMDWQTDRNAKTGWSSPYFIVSFKGSF